MFCAQESTSEGIRDVLRNQALKVQKEKKLMDGLKSNMSPQLQCRRLKNSKQSYKCHWELDICSWSQVKSTKPVLQPFFFHWREECFPFWGAYWLEIFWHRLLPLSPPWHETTMSLLVPQHQFSFCALSWLSLRNMTVWGAESDILLVLNPQTLHS